MICREKGIESARRLLGHANISTTERYKHLDDRELADVTTWSKNATDISAVDALRLLKLRPRWSR